MNILIIGSGAREHVIAATLKRSATQPNIFCCATSRNPGIQLLTTDYIVIDITNIAAVIEFAKKSQIQLAIIGPEAPLEKGIADALWENNIPTIGPKKALARVETDKAFARYIMQKYQLSGLPHYQTFTTSSGIKEFLQQLGEGNYVVKANGLMGGKGVKVAGDHLASVTEALQYAEELIRDGHTIVIEEKLIGQEFSLMAFCDGKQLISMPVVQDHKRAFVDDKGPNTGGMGSYSMPNHSLPFLTAEDLQKAEQINSAMIQALQAETQQQYIGILYGSFIATRNGIYVIEFNARFGDPEALNVLSILETDFVELCQSLISGELANIKVQFAPYATVCKYVVPEGYPDAPIKNKKIAINAVEDKSHLYLAAVDIVDNAMIATGSRTAAYVGIAPTLVEAEKIAEAEVCRIIGPVFHRADIGTEKLIQLRIDDMHRLRTA